jgi:hypothetical protein
MRKYVIGLSVLSVSSCFAEAKQESEFPLGAEVTVALDSFRSLPDGSWGGNMGAYTAMNFGWAVPKVRHGVGVQLGGSYGIYDWDGRGSTSSKSLQQQTFVTVGAFRVTPDVSGFNAGLVYDWSINAKAGVFGLSPTMEQIRGQIGYLFKGGNEFGLWSAYGIGTSHRPFMSFNVKFRAISQVNIFWRHIFKNKGETMIWAGSPYRKGLMYGSGRAGDYIIGAAFRAPLSRHFSVDGHGVYMGARSGTADEESKNYAANVCLGLTYSFGGCKAGTKPYLPLANNSNFLADTNLSY